MKQTKHIDFTNGNYAGDNPVLFPEQNLVISFASRANAADAVKQANWSEIIAVPLYAPKEDSNGA